MTALIAASMGGHKDVVEWIVQVKMCDVNAVCFEGRTALHHAVLSTSHDIMRLLLANGAEVNTISCTGRSPLGSALRRQDFTAINMLIEAGAKVHTTGVYNMTPCYTAVEKPAPESVDWLMGSPQWQAMSATDRKAAERMLLHGCRDLNMMLIILK